MASRLLIAALITAAFAVTARLMRAVTTGGAIAGFACAFVIYFFAGLQGFLVLGTVFLLTVISTRLGYARKLRLGTAERREGRRASQILANLVVAAAIVVVGGIRGWPLFGGLAAAALAALCEAAADTVSSEIGQLASSRPRLITTFQPVDAGTNGAISLVGTLTGAFAALLVASAAAAFQITAPRAAGIAATAGFLGMLVDSLLGATLERRGALNNDAVNFLSTLFAAALTALIFTL